MSGINPQGCQVFSFKAPSAEERDHDYLWRSHKALPERGRIGIHNRSYYEEVLVCRVHPEILAVAAAARGLQEGRYLEAPLSTKSTTSSVIWSTTASCVLKFFLHVSKEEQKKRFLERIDQNEKNWKFSVNDAKERAFWKDYMHAYEDVFTHTSTKDAPWYIIPADNKWFMRLAVAAITYQTLDDLEPQIPDGQQGQEERAARIEEGAAGGKGLTDKAIESVETASGSIRR